MLKRKAIILVIEDDRKWQDAPFTVEITAVFDRIVFRENINDALLFVRDNLQSKIIILLDLAFSANLTDGIKFLESLRNLSKLIPVIVWSGKDIIEGAEYQKMINESTFAFLKKSASSTEITDVLCKADDYLNSKIDTAVESCLKKHSEEKKNKPFLTSADGHNYSMNDLLKEIRMQTPFGQSIALNMNKLTIDLLFRNKEKI